MRKPQRNIAVCGVLRAAVFGTVSRTDLRELVCRLDVTGPGDLPLSVVLRRSFRQVSVMFIHNIGRTNLQSRQTPRCFLFGSVLGGKTGIPPFLWMLLLAIAVFAGWICAVGADRPPTSHFAVLATCFRCCLFFVLSPHLHCVDVSVDCVLHRPGCLCRPDFVFASQGKCPCGRDSVPLRFPAPRLCASPATLLRSKVPDCHLNLRIRRGIFFFLSDLTPAISVLREPCSDVLSFGSAAANLHHGSKGATRM